MWINSVSWWHSNIILQKLQLLSASFANESNLKKFDLSNVLPSWLLVHLQASKHNKHFLYSSYSLKQAQIWSQEYASLSDSSANLKEWQCQIIEKNALMKKVLTT